MWGSNCYASLPPNDVYDLVYHETWLGQSFYTGNRALFSSSRTCSLLICQQMFRLEWFLHVISSVWPKSSEPGACCPIRQKAEEFWIKIWRASFVYYIIRRVLSLVWIDRYGLGTFDIIRQYKIVASNSNELGIEHTKSGLLIYAREIYNIPI